MRGRGRFRGRGRSFTPKPTLDQSSTPAKPPRPMSSTRRIVLKFGSGILANARGSGLDERQFRRLCAEVAGVVEAGSECIVVSSGAVAAGLGVLGLKKRPEELAARQ